MELRFLATAEDGLRWMLHYYARVFPEGREGAVQRYEAAKQLLRDQPKSGKRFSDDERVRELVDGKLSENDDIGGMLATEAQIREAAENLKTYLDVAASFGGREVIEL